MASHVQSNSSTGSGTVISLAFVSDTTAGNATIVGLGSAGGTFTSITDTDSNTYSTPLVADPSSGAFEREAHAVNINGGALTVSGNFSASAGALGLCIHEYSGIATSSPVRQSTTATAFGTSVTTSSITIQNGDILVAVGSTETSQTKTFNASYTTRRNDTGNSGQISADRSPGAGSYTADFSGGGTTNYMLILVGFKPAVSCAITGTITSSITEADIVSGGKTIIATLTNDTYVSNTITAPVIEAADCTVSGNNTAEATWAVSTPAAVSGDLLIFYIAWDDSTATTDVTEPAGKQSETLSEINATPVTDSSTETRAKAWYCICTGTWTAGTITFTPSATESWSATVIKVPAGEFDGSTPIGASNTRAASGTADTAALSPAFTAGASDGDGRLVWCAGVDADPLTGTITGWTVRQTQDLGAVTHGVATRDSAVTDSESIAGGDTWTIASDSWTSIAFIVRPPTATPFENARQAFINGFDSAQSESGGWDAKVKAAAAVTEVVRTSDTVVTWTVAARADYNITAQETITGTIPASILTGNAAINATPTFTIDTSGSPPATVIKDIIGGCRILYPR